MRQGTEEWFANIDDIMAQFSAYGLWVLKNVMGVDLTGDCTQQDPVPAPTTQQDLLGQLLYQAVPGSDLINIAKNTPAALQAIQDMLRSFMGTTFGDSPIVSQATDAMVSDLDFGSAITEIKQFICQHIQVLVQCSTCNWTSLLGLYAARLMLTLFETFRFDIIIGFNFIGTAWAKPAFSLALKAVQLQRLLDSLIEYACPSKLPDFAQSQELSKNNLVTDTHYLDLARMTGVDDIWADRLLYAKREKLDRHEYLEFAKRHPELGIDPDLALRNIGFLDEKERAAAIDLYNKSPDLQELLFWLQRNVFNTEYVKDFDLLQGFSDDNTNEQVLQKIAGFAGNQQGRPLFYDTFKKWLDVAGIPQEQAAMAYAAHWLPVPREIGAEMVQRLRPGRVDPSLQFTEQQYRQTLIEQDVPPWALDRYIALTYNKLNQRFLQRMYEFNVISKDELIEYLRDTGFHKEDAGRIADMMSRLVKIQRTTQVRGYDVANVVGLYKGYVLTADDVRTKLSDLGFSKQEVADCLQVADSEVKVKLNEQTIAAVRKGYISGEITRGQARDSLAAVPVPDVRVSDLITLWELERQTEQKMMSAHDIQDAVKRGLLSLSDAANMLFNQDYSLTTISYVLAVAVQDVAKAQKQQQQQAAKQQAALAKAIEQQLVKQQKAAKQNAKLKLDLDKALRRAQAILDKNKVKEVSLKARAAARKAKATAKGNFADAVATAKQAGADSLQDALLQARTSYLGAVAARKGQLAAALAATSDKTVKATLHAEALADLAALAVSYQSQVEAVRDAARKALEAAKDDAGSTELAAIDAAATQEQQAVLDELSALAAMTATSVRQDAQDSYAVGSLPG